MIIVLQKNAIKIKPIMKELSLSVILVSEKHKKSNVK